MWILIKEQSESNDSSLPLHLYRCCLSGLSRCRRHVLLGEADQLGKALGVFNRHVGEDFSVQGDIGLLQGVDEPSIAQALAVHRSEHLYDAMFNDWNDLNS